MGIEFPFNKAGKIPEQLNGGGGKLTRAMVHEAERADATAILMENRKA